MNKKEALAKLKKYWLENEGADYLESLISLRREMPKSHESIFALNEEIERIQIVYPQFMAWKDSTWAQRKLSKMENK